MQRMVSSTWTVSEGSIFSIVWASLKISPTPPRTWPQPISSLGRIFLLPVAMELVTIFLTEEIENIWHSATESNGQPENSAKKKDPAHKEDDGEAK